MVEEREPLMVRLQDQHRRVVVEGNLEIVGVGIRGVRISRNEYPRIHRGKDAETRGGTCRESAIIHIERPGNHVTLPEHCSEISYGDEDLAPDDCRSDPRAGLEE